MPSKAVWQPGRAVRFPAVAVTRAAAKNNAGWTYYFGERLLVAAISEGLLGEAAMTTWNASPIGLADRLFDISGIFRVLDRGCFDFEVIHIPTVMERDQWRCHICGDAIDRATTHGPGRPSLDHVVPIAAGGAHTYENVKASHWRCNHRKGGRMR